MPRRSGPIRLAAVLDRLRRDRRGGTAVLVALLLAPLLGFVGLAVDSARAHLVQSRLSRALDAAGLAGGRHFDEPARRDADIRRYFDANFPDGYLGARTDGPHWTVDAQARAITLTASAELDTLFMRALGRTDIGVAARSVIEQARNGMELVLVMDNTGSMYSKPSLSGRDDPEFRNTRKIDAMKAGAAELIGQLYGSRTTIDRVWVGLVPFTATVNIGPQRTAWLRDYDPQAFAASPQGWKGCIEERVPRVERGEPPLKAGETGADVTDEPPRSEALKWRPFLFPPTRRDNEWPPVDESAATNTTGNGGRGPNVGCPPAITPLTADRTTVLNGIAAMDSWHRGGTQNHVGLVWAWRMLSPAWRGLWGGEMNAEGLPLPYDEKRHEKAVILLTDGQNQFNNDDYTAYGKPSWGRLGVTTAGAGKTALDERLTRVCTAMKRQRIRIYTITFDVPESSGTWQVFRECASTADDHFDSRDSSSLRAAFRAIADRLRNLHVAE
ncbi:pilus assembly protein TadG-related protein [Azospirillum sp. ST 5-10]|uniref:pilus assembly protein TadG-related protein n=1 Tax=unclassified Azospirillum TaxID=2630922 RepID=UPI003F4A44F3